MFEVDKYMGLWYELMHSPDFFETRIDFNTTAKYEIIKGDKVIVSNRTIRDGQYVGVHGMATYLGNGQLYIDFSNTNVVSSVPNYIVHRLWLDCDSNYIAAIVTNTNKSYFSVLCRTPYISSFLYNELQQYVLLNFPNLMILQTPHYDENIYRNYSNL